MKHKLALDRLLMTYSWYNIRKDYGNNRIKYTHNKGLNWETISFTDEMNSYSDINDYIHQYMKQKKSSFNRPKGANTVSNKSYFCTIYLQRFNHFYR